MSYGEKKYENAVLYLLEQLGYTRYYGPDDNEVRT